MAWENLPTWPNEGNLNWTGQFIDSITWPQKTEISKTINDVDSYYEKRIAESREWLEEIKITKENVVAGLKFIAEHPDMEHNQLVDSLISLGCNFTWSDIDKQFWQSNEKSFKSIFKILIEKLGGPREGSWFVGMRKWKISCGARIIVNIMMGWYWLRAKEYFFEEDNTTSVYHFIRKVTGDKKYTKEYVDSLVKKQK